MYRFKNALLPLFLVLGLFTFGCNQAKQTADNSSDSKTEEPPIPQGTQVLSEEAQKAAKQHLGVGQPSAFLFYADWCPVCRSFKPILDQAEAKHPDIKIVRFNVEEQADVTKSFKVTSIPTLFLFDKDGNFLRSIPGAIPEDQLDAKFKELESGSMKNSESK